MSLIEHRRNLHKKKEVEVKTKEQAKKGGMAFSIVSIICGLVGFFLIAGEFLGIFGAIMGYYGVKEGSKLGYVGLVFGVIVFLLTVGQRFM